MRVWNGTQYVDATAEEVERELKGELARLINAFEYHRTATHTLYQNNLTKCATCDESDIAINRAKRCLQW